MDARITFQVIKKFGNLSANFADLNKAVTEQVAKYKGLVYDETQIAEAKKDLASLRSDRKRIDDARKDVKAEFMKPYDDFEKQLKETLKIYDSAITEINQQVQDVEQAEKRRKKKEIEQWWDRNGVTSIQGITIEKVWDDRYLNKTFTAKKWQEDLIAKKNRIEADLSTLSFLEAEKINFMLPIYVETLDLNTATQRYETFKANQRASEQARLEMERKQAEREEKREIKPVKEETKPIIKPEETMPKQPKTASKTYHMTFEIVGNEPATKELCDVLRRLKSNGGLTFRVIESKVEEE